MQAKAAPGMARPLWWAVGDLLTAMGERTEYFLASDVFAEMAARTPGLSGMSYETLGLRGAIADGAGQRAEATR
jgi:predicted molibdopterin-dependent oxidoreductase YjgC